MGKIVGAKHAEASLLQRTGTVEITLLTITVTLIGLSIKIHEPWQSQKMLQYIDASISRQKFIFLGTPDMSGKNSSNTSK